MATGFIMCRHDFRYGRIFKLWRQVVGYSLAVTCFASLFVPSIQVGWRDWVSSAFPVLFDKYWFFTEYVALFFTIPFLNKLLDNLSRKEMVVMLFSGFCLFSIASLIAGRDLFITKWGYSYVWFVYLYMLGASLALCDVKSKVGKGVLWGMLFGGCLLSGGGAFGSSLLPRLIGGGARVGDLAYSYTSPALLMEAVALLLLFSKIKVENQNLTAILKFAAPGGFIVYVIHSDVVFRRMTSWNSCFSWFSDYGALGAVIGSAMVGVLLFVMIVGVDCLRRWICGFVFVSDKR